MERIALLMSARKRERGDVILGGLTITIMQHKRRGIFLTKVYFEAEFRLLIVNWLQHR